MKTKWIALAAAVLFCVAAVPTVAHAAGSKLDVEAPSDAPETAGLAPEVVIGIVAAAIVVCGGIAAFVWLRHRKKSAAKNDDGGKTEEPPDTPPQAPAEPAPAQSAAPPAGCCLVAVGGVMDGCVFPLSERDVVIGRRPDKCAIILPDGVPGVSSVHCRVSRTERGYALTDLGSSNGTFLNGVYLEPNVPAELTPGCAFYLGGPVNSFIYREG